MFIQPRVSSAIAWPLFLLALSPTSYAHHGAAAHFDQSTTIVLEGKISELKLVNPHSYFYFDVLGESGEVENWRCELGTRLSRRGWNEATLVSGDRVRVTANPARREPHFCKLEFIEHEDGRTIPFRGEITEGTSTYVPGDDTQFPPGSDSADSLVLATSDMEAASRIIVEVPENGFFGYWAAQWRTGGGMGMGMGGPAGMAPAMGAPAPVASELPAPTQLSMPKYTAAGQELAGAYDPGFDNSILKCRSSIFDGMTHYGLPNEFVEETKQTIRWVYGFMDLVRYIHMDGGQAPVNSRPVNFGHSVGHWEGETLVVETTGFRKDLFMQLPGERPVINSEQLRVIERVTHDKPLDQLVVEYSAEDPQYWEAPISGVIRLSRAEPYETYGCVELAGENNRRSDGSTLFD